MQRGSTWRDLAGAASAALTRRHGLRRTLLGAALFYALGCIGAALAPNMAMMLAARLVQGVCGGMMVALSYVAIQQLFSEHLWGRLFAIVSLIWFAGSLLGPLIGGVFADAGLWRGAFWSFAVQAVVLCAAAWALLVRAPGRPQERAGPSWWPLLLLAAATLLIGEAGAAHELLGSSTLAIAGLALLYAAALRDRRAPIRLLPGELLEIGHPIGAGLLMVFALAAATTGFWAYGPLILKIGFATDPLVAGYILAGEAVAWSAATMAVSGLPDRSSRPLIRGGAAAVIMGAAGFVVAVPAGSLAGMIACALLQGAGFGAFWPSIMRRIVGYAQPAEQSLAATAAPTVQRIGYAVGAAATGIAANAAGLADGMTVAAARAAAIWVFAAFIPLLVVGGIAAWRFTAAAAEERLRTPATSAGGGRLPG